MALPNNNPTTILVSSKGQIVLPALLRRKLGMGAGATLQVIEEPDGLKLRVMRSVATSDVSSLAGLIKLQSRGVSRDLGSFDPASLLTRKGKRTP